MPSPLLVPLLLTPASPGCTGTMAADASLVWNTTVALDNHDQPCVEVQGYTLRTSYILGALGPSPAGEAAGTLLP